MRNGSGLVRALERSARGKGVSFRLNHRMTGLDRTHPDGQVNLVHVDAPDGKALYRARKGIVLATGGSSGNVALRRMFDPRLTDEYQHAGAPYSYQTGDGEIAAMAQGATLWGTAAQTAGTMLTICKTVHIGCQWGYHALKFNTDSPVFHRVRATGLTVTDWQNVILVNQCGERFWNEVDESQGFINAALAYNRRSTDPNGGGPIWAIFDSAAVEREGWLPRPPHTDPAYFATGSDFAELCANMNNPYQKTPMEADALAAQVARYNSFVDGGEDLDFGKPRPLYKIEKPPFYAAWATPILHDTYAGLRIDAGGNVLNLHGDQIPRLFAAGEVQGGFSQHGLARCIVFGRLAGISAATL
jgi:succinate dehydrogenase/fumarate reductase flavoprotein subunit